MGSNLSLKLVKIAASFFLRASGKMRSAKNKWPPTQVVAANKCKIKYV